KISPKSDPVEDIHYLIVLSRLQGGFELIDWVKRLLAVNHKLDERKRNRDRNWPLRLVELVSEMARDNQKALYLLEYMTDLSDPEHIIYARCSGLGKIRLANRIASAYKQARSIAWTAEHVAVIGELKPDACRPILRDLWNRGGLEEAILPIIAREPEA